MRTYVRSFFAALIAVGCIGLGVDSARAQQQELPRQRSGYYIAQGFSFAQSRFWVDDGNDRSISDGSMSFRFGQMITPHFGLGLRVAQQFKSQQAVLGVEGQWEFARHLALRAGAGLGIAVLDKDPSDIDSKQQGTAGAGYTLALSYDIFLGLPMVSGGLSIVPVIEARFVPGSDLSALTALFGIEISYWTGLPRDQLILPDKQAYRRRR